MKGAKECTTLCYLEKDNKYLVMHRCKRRNDENSEKYIGIGGHMEKGETPEECIRRETLEETGLTLNSLKYRGLLTFVFDNKDELAFLYTSSDFSGDLNTRCDEGELMWVDKEELLDYPIWEGDKIFLKRLNESIEPFSLKLVYEGDTLVLAEFLS